MTPQSTGLTTLAFRCKTYRGDGRQGPDGERRVSDVDTLLIDPGSGCPAPLPALD
jgi:hypothetical protein